MPPPKPPFKDENEPVDNTTEENADSNSGQDQGMAGSVDEWYIKDAAQAVSDLSPGDFKDMPDLKVPTDADDGEDVQVLLTGTAKDGFLTGVMGAETTPLPAAGEDQSGKDDGKSRLKIMIMGGNEEGKSK